MEDILIYYDKMNRVVDVINTETVQSVPFKCVQA